MSEIAEKIGISPVNLSASLNGNPTLSRLEEVASVLGVQVKDLFTDEVPISVNGYVEINGEIHKINSSDDIGKVFNLICELNANLIK